MSVQLEFHWQGCFPEWMPKVGGYCSFDTTVYEGRGAEQIEGEADRRYCYMAELKILKIEGRNIDCVGVVRRYYKGCEAHVGKLYFATMDDIWLATYITEGVVPIEVITEEVIAKYEREEAERNERNKRLEAMDKKAQAHNKKTKTKSNMKNQFITEGKGRKKKYLLVVIEERNGEQEYTHRIVREVDTLTNIENFADKIASGWYEDNERGKKKRDGGYYFWGDSLFAQVDRVEVISETDYLTLSKYL